MERKTADEISPDQIIRYKQVREMTGGLGRTTLWRLENKGEFPKRIMITGHIVGWVRSEVVAWIASRKRK